MRTRMFTLRIGAAALAYASLAVTGNTALAAEYWLRAAATTVTMPPLPGGPQVVMWGYAKCDANYAACSDPITVPGPALTVPPGDTTLIVHLRNDLTGPTSMVIHGLIKPMTPVWDNGAIGARPNLQVPARVRSFDAEAAPGGGTVDYTWSNVNPGTYLYQSGTQPQVQVQMGLYGAVTKNFANPVPAVGTDPAVRGQAYAGTGFEFDNEVTLLYSEIDPDLHAAVANGDYGPGKGTTSTIGYTPRYFLINGAPYQFGASVIEPVGSPGTTLLRLLNAGLTTHVPMVQGRHWDLIAEDGKPYPYRKTQYTALLPAAKTVDVLFTPEIGATHAIMDRRLSLSNNGTSDGGMLAFLRFASLGSMAAGSPGNVPPVAANDTYDSVKGVTLNVAARGVLINDTDSDSPVIKAVAARGASANGGTYTLNADGSFTYAPAPAFAGASDSFDYKATDGKALSNQATVTINLATPAAPSSVVLDDFNRADTVAGTTGLGGSWAQTAATASPPNLRISNSAVIASATDLGGQAIWQTSYGDRQFAEFTLGALPDKSALILKATGPDAKAPVNFIRVRYEAGTVSVHTMMGGSNTSAYVKQASFPAAGSGVLSAAADAKGLVTVFQNGVFVGGVQLPDVTAWKGGGRIGIQLQTQNSTVDGFGGGTLP